MSNKTVTMTIRIISPDEIHIITYDYLKNSYIFVNDEKYDLVHFEMDKNTKFKTFMFCKNYK